MGKIVKKLKTQCIKQVNKDESKYCSTDQELKNTFSYYVYIY